MRARGRQQKWTPQATAGARKGSSLTHTLKYSPTQINTAPGSSEGGDCVPVLSHIRAPHKAPAEKASRNRPFPCILRGGPGARSRTSSSSKESLEMLKGRAGAVPAWYSGAQGRETCPPGASGRPLLPSLKSPVRPPEGLAGCRGVRHLQQGPALRALADPISAWASPQPRPRGRRGPGRRTGPLCGERRTLTWGKGGEVVPSLSSVPSPRDPHASWGWLLLPGCVPWQLDAYAWLTPVPSPLTRFPPGREVSPTPPIPTPAMGRNSLPRSQLMGTWTMCGIPEPPMLLPHP